MSVLLLADSQVERVWPNVRNNREAYRTAIFIPVKNFDQMLSGFQGITATVSFKFFWYWRVGAEFRPRASRDSFLSHLPNIDD